MSSLREIDGTVKIEVDAIKIDSLNGILPKINLIKIDIEGAEHLAVLGMKELLIRDRPIIILELTDLF
jgi:FkbM family methyltransferase